MKFWATTRPTNGLCYRVFSCRVVACASMSVAVSLWLSCHMVVIEDLQSQCTQRVGVCDTTCTILEGFIARRSVVETDWTVPDSCPLHPSIIIGEGDYNPNVPSTLAFAMEREHAGAYWFYGCNGQVLGTRVGLFKSVPAILHASQPQLKRTSNASQTHVKDATQRTYRGSAGRLGVWGILFGVSLKIFAWAPTAPITRYACNDQWALGVLWRPLESLSAPWSPLAPLGVP